MVNGPTYVDFVRAIWLACKANWFCFCLSASQRKSRRMHAHSREDQVEKGNLVLDENAMHPSKQDNVVKLINNNYALADASLTWHTHL